MVRSTVPLFLVLAASGPVLADARLKTPTASDDIWETAYVAGEGGSSVKIGYIHLTSQPVKKDGLALVRTSKELRFEIGRGESRAEMRAESSTDEDASGKVQALRAKIQLGKDRAVTLTGTVVENKTLRLRADGLKEFEREFRWDPTCLGLARENSLLRDKKAKTGDKFTYRYFEPQVANYVTVKVAVHGTEKVSIPNSPKRELVKVVMTPDPLPLPEGKKLQLPAGTVYVDPKTYDTVKTVMEIPGIGDVWLVRSTKSVAMAPNGQVPDLMKRQSIYFTGAIPDMHERERVTYRVRYTGDAAAKDLVSSDARQTIANANGQSFDLEVVARRKPVRVAKEEAVGGEFLKSNFFINSDDREVQALAERAVGQEKDPWRKAQKIEGFVRNFMRPADYTEAMAPADHVARTRTGDCTEYSMLTAAMCRAQGVPSRTAIGLVYVNNLLGKPGLAYHMWTEVFVQAQWLAIDATLGQGSIGPGHIKITDHSWHGVESLTPILPVQGFLMAKPSIEVVDR